MQMSRRKLQDQAMIRIRSFEVLGEREAGRESRSRLQLCLGRPGIRGWAVGQVQPFVF
jgi:hypothetical protein